MKTWLMALPEISPDSKTFAFRFKPGTYFSDDPAFKSQRRELVAADYVYPWKRHYDPRWKSNNLYILENAKLLGLRELRQRLIAEKKPFDYEREVEGLRVIDKYTFQLKTAEPNPRLLMDFADGSVWGAVAREAVEDYGDKMMEHPPTAGKLMMWNYGWLAGVPAGNQFLVLGYGPTKGQSNKSRFDLPAYNDIYLVQTVMPNGPERQATIDEAQKLLVAYMPIKAHVHCVYTDLAQPWVLGYHRNPFLREAWRWIDIDTEMQARLAR